ncbi:MAG: radical SAM protein [Blastochloris viridis]|uniref:Radical SAM protein n=1 Tax=Blastochloris viridis TaxID=1079 RepID=A0A6N4RFR9_BLAVI|nr:MAG: radical SAM protein [Blastochloris viridis]
MNIHDSRNTNTASFDRLAHYRLRTGPTHEFGNLPEITPSPRNIGWTLGNDCPYRCNHCYSINAREKGMNMTTDMVDRIVGQLKVNGVETVNLGGNEPLFTNGPNPRDTLLPYIIKRLADAQIIIGLTTSGITLLRLYRDHRDAFELLNDCDISFDSPFEDEHNKNRGARIYHQAVEAMEICQKSGIPHTAIMAAMNWNFSESHIDGLVELAKKYDAHVRINPVKPTEPKHMEIALPADMYYAGFARLMELCSPVDLGEPPLAAVTAYEDAKRCPCGRTSFRIHSITPTGEIHVSPCVYLHDYKAPLDLLKHDLVDIINSDQFRVFRQRNANPEMIDGCSGCNMLGKCGGGCAARSYLYHRNNTGELSMLSRDPYCPKDIKPSHDFPQNPVLHDGERLVHMDYLCTWIGKPV